MRINDEDEKLLFDTDQITARLDLLFVKYLQVVADSDYRGIAAPEKVEATVDSLRENTSKALAGVEALQKSLVAQKAAVAELIARNNRILCDVLRRSGEQAD